MKTYIKIPQLTIICAEVIILCETGSFELNFSFCFNNSSQDFAVSNCIQIAYHKDIPSGGCK